MCLARYGIDYITRDQFGYNYALKDKLFITKDRDKFQRIIVKAAANDNYPFLMVVVVLMFEMLMLIIYLN